MTPYHTITAADLSTGLYLSVRQVEDRTGLRESTIRNYMDQGRFTRYKLQHTATVFLALSEIEAWEAKRGNK